MTHDVLVDEVLGSAAAPIRSTFRAMKIAEEEIAAARECHPLFTTAMQEAFRILCPNELLEAGDRPTALTAGSCLTAQPPTRKGLISPSPPLPSLCAALSKLSLASPLSHDYIVAYDVFRRAFPGAEPVDGFGDLPESYSGRATEILADVARRIGRLCRRS